jgi:hypothetical protein
MIGVLFYNAFAEIIKKTGAILKINQLNCTENLTI